MILHFVRFFHSYLFSKNLRKIHREVKGEREKSRLSGINERSHCILRERGERRRKKSVSERNEQTLYVTYHLVDEMKRYHKERNEKVKENKLQFVRFFLPPSLIEKDAEKEKSKSTAVARQFL